MFSFRKELFKYFKNSANGQPFWVIFIKIYLNVTLILKNVIDLLLGGALPTKKP